MSEELTDARMNGEPSVWYSRFLLYRNMGAARRSLLGAATAYQLSASNSPKQPPKSVPGSWKNAAEHWHWKARADIYDQRLQAEQDERNRQLREIEAEEIERILTTGYALKHKRIESLDKMTRQIEKSFLDPDTGDINPKWLNADKIREFRGCLDDIAKEIGDRQKKTEVTGKDGGPIEFITEWGGGVLETDEAE